MPRESDRMVQEQLVARGIRDKRVLAAMRQVPRDAFVPEEARPFAFADRPLPIGYNQTISQPYIVALMAECAAIRPGDRVLEIGTGCGYEAAVLSLLAGEVFSMDIVEPLASGAAERLKQLGYSVRVRAGDGYAGWPEEAPFNAIVLAAAAPVVPEPLLEQLAPDGRLVMPLGTDDQQLTIILKTPEGFGRKTLAPVQFVRMTGRVTQEPGRDG